MADPLFNPKDVERSPTTPAIGKGASELPKEDVKPFAPYMQEGETSPLMASTKNPQVSPFDLAHGRVPAPGPTLNTIQEQTKVAQASLGDISNQLNTPKLRLKQSTKYLLKNKLSAAKGNILSASDKLGAQAVPEQEVPAGASPLQRFIGFVSSGQNQLQEVQSQLAALSAKGKQMKPADMLTIQIKLSKAQQQLEYSSLLLSKAVDDMKQMMNIQL